ncbi:AfsR/SARP family transcriptional regulator [Allonocardiopsis opalescens]|uniref:DNA-binding SARP family transcriptional activator n=1 Tax=Allonocardiopsis opalescens TaxID=1144618 RepID=A0A2T0QB17_9ACTN|nr:AfsR/SARP family transcriptional regulator [Allonocardiopsis opalescens]PRY01010.1 DNA-binding SARP family transcriptional activator [Allonocardiopsis opalescens]
MRFNVLGSLEIITDDNRSVLVNASKTGQVLALLLMRRNEVVSVDMLIEELWGQRPPRSALTTLRTYIYHARRIFIRASVASSARELLLTQPPGYLIQTTDEQVDATVFENLINEGRTRLDQGRPELAAARLREALSLWRGPAFAHIEVGSLLHAHATHLEELRIRAIHLRLEAERSLGRSRELIPELRSLVLAHPLNESFHAQLIDALHRSGRRAEALQAYQHLRSVLARELGVTPTPEIQRLYHELREGHDARSLSR